MLSSDSETNFSMFYVLLVCDSLKQVKGIHKGPELNRNKKQQNHQVQQQTLSMLKWNENYQPNSTQLCPIIDITIVHQQEALFPNGVVQVCSTECP